MPRIPWILATVLAYISLVAGCTSATRTSPGTGLVSLHPSITSTLVSLGAAEQLVGRSAHCSEPEVSRLPAMGHELAPTLEPLAALGRTRAGDHDELVERGIQLTLNTIATGLRNSG